MYGWKWFLALGLISERLMLVLQGMHDCGCIHIINPWRIHKGYSSHSVCVSICYQASCYVHFENQVSFKLPMIFSRSVLCGVCLKILYSKVNC